MADGEAPARVWIIGADHWPRAYLRAELIERGHDAVGFEAVADALLELSSRPAARPRLVVLDLAGADDALVTPLFRLGVPVLAIAGATDDRDPRRPWAAFLHRPVTIGAVADAVERGLR